MIALGMALFSIFYTPPKDTDTLQSNTVPASMSGEASVLSESTKATQTTEADVSSYEQTLSMAQSRCSQAGLQPGSPEFDHCTEQEISQLGH